MEPEIADELTWATDPSVPDPLLGAPATRVITVEHGWAPHLLHAGLNVHVLGEASFTLLDAAAGYWVSEQDVRVEAVHRVENCFTALAEHAVELRLTPSLWPYVDAVVAAKPEFSAIRLRNALPRVGL
ncbi:hypothetical protein ADL15_03570 [Actinoplanes awajinensis subsp. mycoplanecinus]|uniref:Uncharacterized protein n=2 Tax=Actinoplanes awajinensis TaxID=135946 RepID=A0A0X3VA84_9ACTN|nr:hypothetical protein ADL15_03570 [Actinoplanes awajinensis subsp. mycoplanecinus]